MRQNLQSTFLSIQFFLDRKSTRLNSSHSSISYAVFCLKKKKNKANIYCSKKNKNHFHVLIALPQSETFITLPFTYLLNYFNPVQHVIISRLSLFPLVIH